MLEHDEVRFLGNIITAMFTVMVSLFGITAIAAREFYRVARR